jgi:hypothetical protein
VLPVRVQPTPVTTPRRTFIRPNERPDLDAHVINKARES